MTLGLKILKIHGLLFFGACYKTGVACGENLTNDFTFFFFTFMVAIFHNALIGTVYSLTSNISSLSHRSPRGTSSPSSHGLSDRECAAVCRAKSQISLRKLSYEVSPNVHSVLEEKDKRWARRKCDNCRRIWEKYFSGKKQFLIIYSDMFEWSFISRVQHSYWFDIALRSIYLVIKQ